jgi:hypothetical protein
MTQLAGCAGQPARTHTRGRDSPEAKAASVSIDTLTVPTKAGLSGQLRYPWAPLLVRRAQPGSLLDAGHPASTTNPSSGQDPLEQVEWT